MMMMMMIFQARWRWKLSSRMVCQEDFAGKPVSRSMNRYARRYTGLWVSQVHMTYEYIWYDTTMNDGCMLKIYESSLSAPICYDSLMLVAFLPVSFQQIWLKGATFQLNQTEPSKASFSSRLTQVVISQADKHPRKDLGYLSVVRKIPSQWGGMEI